MLIDINAFEKGANMTPALWERTSYFNWDEEWGDPYKMWVHLIYYLDALRHWIDNKFIINCGWEKRDSGWHPKGAATDGYSPTINYKDLAYKAMQFPFTGIGLYPYWNNPGVHLDVRPLRMDSRRRVWWRDEWKELVDGEEVIKHEYHNINTLEDLQSLPSKGIHAFR